MSAITLLLGIALVTAVVFVSFIAFLLSLIQPPSYLYALSLAEELNAKQTLGYLHMDVLRDRYQQKLLQKFPNAKYQIVRNDTTEQYQVKQVSLQPFFE